MEIILAKTPEMVRTRNLGANTCLQFAPNVDVAGSSGSAPVFLADFLCMVQGQQFNQFRPVLADATFKDRPRLHSILLAVICEQLVPLRPYRAEPRVTKRRPKSFPRMQQPRSVLKAKLVA